jgi:hypothetical protein
VKFLPSAGGGAYGLNFASHTIFAATGRGCDGVANGLWAIDLTSTQYPVANYSTGSIRTLSLAGPVLTPDGNAIVVTGAAKSDAGQDDHPGSVVEVDKNMKVKDWYSIPDGLESYEYVSPIVFEYKGKQLIAAPGKDGSIVLLDQSSLGGGDHHTALAESAPLAKQGEKHHWDGFAAWQDKDGNTWLFASVSAALSVDGDVKLNGATPHGGIVAFKVEDAGSQPALKPVWVSGDMVNPAPPRVANGVVVALAEGNPSTHATLFMLDAGTGAEIYSSKDEVPTYTGLSSVAFGDSHAFFIDHNNVLYSFGIGMEH